MKGPLEGVRVLDLTRLLPGGYCTQLLADLGADVIKVEEPGRGDYIRWTPPMVGEYSAAHWVLNRNKRSITLNLKHTRGRDLLLELCKTSHVFVEGFRPGVMDKLGLGYGDVSSVNPAIVYCSISGYGQSGPYQKKAGHDINYIGYAGVLGFTGTAEGTPVLPGVQIGDLGGGGALAAVGILAALYRASLEGKGEYLDIAMMDGVVSWLTIHAAKYFGGGGEPTWASEVLNGSTPCYNVYKCADGKWITVGALEPQFWREFCRGIGREDLIGSQFRKDVISEVQSVIETKPRKEWLEILEQYDACVGPVNSVAEALEDPQVRHRKMVISQQNHSGEEIDNLGTPLKFDESDASELAPAPELGQHNAEVLAEVGVGASEISVLKEQGVI